MSFGKFERGNSERLRRLGWDLRDLVALLDLPLSALPATSDTATMQPRDLLKMTRWVWEFTDRSPETIYFVAGS